ncbi:MAG: barstar family protein [Saccharofermentanales bacterium]
MRTIVIDGNEMRTREDAHAYLSRRLSFPDYYGQNLDALHDCLGEIGEPTNIVIYHYDALEKSLGTYAASIRDVLSHAQEENHFLTILFDVDSE